MLTVLGTTTVDIFVRGVSQLPERADDEFSNASLVWVDSPVLPALGGNGANAAYVAAALGEKVRLWSAVGDDPFGKMALEWLAARGVDTSQVYVSKEAHTANTVVITDALLRRASFHHPGPSSEFAALPGEPGGAGDWLLVTSYPLYPHWRGRAALDLLSGARRAGLHTALDIGPIIGDPVTADELAPLLGLVDVLLCNGYELEEVSGAALAGGVGWAFSCGARSVVVKLGGEGALAFAGPESNGVRVPAFKVDVVGTVGAGDSFDAGLLYLRGRGASLEESALFGNATAALVVSSPRGVLDAPDEGAVRDFIARNTRKE